MEPNLSPSLLPTELNEFSGVYVDVYFWLLKGASSGRLPMEGIFRHAEELSRRFTPAVYCTHEEIMKLQEQVEAFRALTGKGVIIFQDVKEFLGTGIKAWISLGVDLPAPFIAGGMPFKKIAILHDTMAGEGFYGDSQIDRFRYGATYHDAFAYVSVSTLHAFVKVIRKLGVKTPDFIPYGCFHRYTEMPTLLNDQREATRMLGVHSIWHYKNVVSECDLARSLDLDFYHVGSNNYLPPEAVSELELRGNITLLGQVSDIILEEQYRKASYFTCLSSMEGFSMPPMEAVLAGIPFIFISPISAHKEIYGKLNVNFVDPELASEYKMDKLLRVKEEDRAFLYSEYKSDKVFAPLEDYLRALK